MLLFIICFIGFSFLSYLSGLPQAMFYHLHFIVALPLAIFGFLILLPGLLRELFVVGIWPKLRSFLQLMIDAMGFAELTGQDVSGSGLSSSRPSPRLSRGSRASSVSPNASPRQSVRNASRRSQLNPLYVCSGRGSDAPSTRPGGSPRLSTGNSPWGSRCGSPQPNSFKSLDVNLLAGLQVCRSRNTSPRQSPRQSPPGSMDASPKSSPFRRRRSVDYDSTSSSDDSTLLEVNSSNRPLTRLLSPSLAKTTKSKPKKRTKRQNGMRSFSPILFELRQSHKRLLSEGISTDSTQRTTSDVKREKTKSESDEMTENKTKAPPPTPQPLD